MTFLTWTLTAVAIAVARRDRRRRARTPRRTARPTSRSHGYRTDSVEAPLRGRTGGGRRRDRRSGLQRAAHARGLDPPAARLPRGLVPVLVADRGRRQREHRRDARDRPAPELRARRRRGDPSRRRRGAAARCVRAWSRGPTLACCATWTSTSRPTWPRCCRWSRRCSRATATSRSAPGFTARRARAAQPQARADLAFVQPPATARAARPVQRRAVRLQGDPRRRRSRPAAGRAGPGLVLRHRAARARAAARPADPRGAGRLGRGHRLARRHRCRPRWPTCAASCGCCFRRAIRPLTLVSPRRPMLAP